MPVLYIASNQPQAGKTSLASALACYMLDNGHTVAVVKAITSDQKLDYDTQAYTQLLNQNLATIIPIHVSEGQLNESLTDDGIQQIRKAVALLRKNHSLVIVEGLSSIDPQKKESQTSVRLAHELDAKVLLVAKFRANLSPAELTPTYELFGKSLSGIVINSVTRYKKEHVENSLLPILKQAKIPVLGWIPEDRTLLGVTVGEIANHMNGHFLNSEDKSSNLVEHFLIGALVLDSGTIYFERVSNKAVIVRGNRPDVQMAALRTSTMCLVLTGNNEPIQYIQHEAQEEGVPLIKTSYSTIEATNKLDDLIANAKFNHPRKLMQIKSLIDQHLDMATLSYSLVH